MNSADVLLLGANYDTGVTPPPFFAEHIMPWLKKLAGMLHSKDKFLLTHTDGENTGLLDYYLKSEIDRCPIKMEAIQFYAEMFEKANQNHSETVFEIKKLKAEIAQLHKQSSLILSLLKQILK